MEISETEPTQVRDFFTYCFIVKVTVKQRAWLHILVGCRVRFLEYSVL
jgi:hypothetical protein